MAFLDKDIHSGVVSSAFLATPSPGFWELASVPSHDVNMERLQFSSSVSKVVLALSSPASFESSISDGI
eukprot:5290492-Ditylum_brightwellii.AAC.1